MDLNHITLPKALVSDLYGSVLVESEQGTGNREQGTGSSKQGTGSREQGAGSREQGAGSREQGAVRSDAAQEWKFLGENKKQILVVVNYPDAVHIADDDLALLVKMLSACKLTVADVAIVNMQNYPDNRQKELTANFQSRIVLLFGVDPVSFGLPMNFPEYQIQPFSGATYLYSPSLTSLPSNREAREKLWESLQRLFGLKV